MPTSKRRELIDNQEKQLSLTRQCELLGISKSGYYYRPRIVDGHTLRVMEEIDRIYTEFPYYGRRKMVHELQNRGIDIGERHTGTLMRRMGIEAIYPKPALSYNKREYIPYPYLLTNLTVERANQVWATDITYVKMMGGYMYLTAVLDWWSRYVVSWELSNTLTTDFCVSAIKKGLNHGKPEIMNSDQGVQFTSQAYINVLTEHDIKISMDHKGRCFDNIFVERLWRTVKYEEIYLHEYESVRELHDSLQIYFQKYNERRLHAALGYKTPASKYFGS